MASPNATTPRQIVAADGADRATAVATAAAGAGDPNELVIPIGRTGILVGAALRDDPHAAVPIQRDDMIMWSLTDPQRATRVVMDTSDFYVRQLLLRAAAAGERIAIYSDSPQRRLALSQPNIAVVERRSSFRRSSSTTDRSHTRRRVCRQRS